ncbi:MAG: DUF5008 domain-containing protein [Sphingobacterium sp.]
MIKLSKYFFGTLFVLITLSCSREVEFYSEPYQDGASPLGIVIERTQRPTPEEGLPGTEVKFSVSGLSEYQDQAQFTFNGEIGEILAITEDEVTVRVPSFASTGVTSIRVGDIVIYGPEFKVLGKVQLDPTWAATYGATGGNIMDMFITPEDKRIFIGGFTNYENKGLIKPNNRIVRTFRNGEYDATFRVGTGANGVLNDIVQVQNNYYLAGSFSGFDQRIDHISNLTRIDLNGRIDTMAVKPFRRPDQSDTTKYYPKFNGGFNSTVANIFKHQDKILAVGSFRFHIHRIYGKPNFMETRDSVILDSTEIRSVALLNLDGTLDSTFRFEGGKALSGANGSTAGVYHESGALKGKLLVYGGFTTFDGQPRGYIARLNADGRLDNTFNPDGQGASYMIYSVTYNRMTNQYLVTGDFKTFNGQSTPKMVLLNADGTIDENFQVKDFAEGYPSYAKQLDDGLIVASGGFREYDGIARSGFLIMDSQGDLVPGMNNSGYFSGSLNKVIETQSDDGKRALLLLGEFSKFDNQEARNITRIIIE